jgi:uncharacterized membrane protein (UPF0182 family)
MFSLIYLLLLIGSGAIFITGIKKGKSSQITAGIVLFLFVLAFFWFINFWGEKLWFDSLGYTDRFWILELAQWGAAAAGFMVGALVVWLMLLGISPERRWIRYLGMLLGALYAMNWGWANWPLLLLFINKVPTEVIDPIFGMTTSFYFFSLPFYNAILNLLMALFAIAIIASLLVVFVDPDSWRRILNANRWQNFSWNQQAFSSFADPALYNPLLANSGFFLLVLAGKKYLDRFELMYSGSGVVYGPGWTDVNVRLPMIWLVIGVCVLVGLLLIISPLRGRFRYWMTGRFRFIGGNPGTFLLALMAFLALVWFVSLSIIPGMFQNFKVNPNEITLEQPYIINNIHFTREAFNLNKVQEKEYPVINTFNRQTVQENSGVFSNIRLWDYRALDEVYKQFQEFRLYYEFEDIDIDRYRYNGQYNQVMISAREMDVNNLPAQSQTFVNRKFKYTHGFGVVLNNVSEFTASGLPQLLVSNIPPVSKFPELTVEEPRIYYGESADEYVVANSAEEEFDYPSGDNNVYNKYSGTGGVRLDNYWQQFLFAYKFNETKLLFSGYPQADSRIMFHRSIRERAGRLAPFLQFDEDPYIVLAEGRLYWMMDAYTVSNNYPYSQPYATIESAIRQQERADVQRGVGQSLRSVNYIRNSVKVVVDAYNGTVDFYMFDQEDPLIQTWNNIVPGLMKPWQEMPKSLLEHIRYPADLLLVQGIVYAKYHMMDPTVFYNQEDLWVRATEKYYDQVQPVEPYYIMWQLPEEPEHSFVLMMPFTPKNRQVLNGWLAGMCDPENYGELLAYNFPKDKRVIGPQQVETKIDQDPNLSSQLSLWDQRGSRVIRGNVLAIPVNETLFYVEPIYLQAETAAYPELRLVVVMHNDNMAYAPTFESALQKVLEGTDAAIAERSSEVIDGEETTEAAEADANQAPRQPIPQGLNERVRAANQAFEDYLRYTGEKDFQRASEALNRLEENLKALERERQ